MKTLFTKLLITLLFSMSLLHATVKIMPLGDSITEDWYYGDNRTNAYKHSYRNHLWYKLKNVGHDVDFVGTKSNGGAIVPSFDGDYVGTTGYTCSQIASLVYSSLQQTSPDIILLHIGTNDSMYHFATDMTGIESILDEIDRYEQNYKTHITVILARIVNLPKAGSWVPTFNNSLDSMAATRVSNGDDIVMVNMQPISSLIDGIHPTNYGYSQMADIWFNALDKAIKDKTKDDDYAYLIPVYGLLFQ